MSSDYKNHRVEDPTKISSRQEKQVKKYVQDYFEKAVAKKKEHDKKKAERKPKEAQSGGPITSEPTAEVKEGEKLENSDGDQDMATSDDEDTKRKQETATPITPLDQLLNAEGLKRKRGGDDDPDNIMNEDQDATPSKRLRSETPPPPPPPPPSTDMTLDPSCLLNNAMENGTSPTADNGKYSMNDHDGPPPPPPPPQATGPLQDDMDISGHAHAPDIPDMRLSDDDDNVHEQDSHQPEHHHDRFPELQIEGGA